MLEFSVKEGDFALYSPPSLTLKEHAELKEELGELQFPAFTRRGKGYYTIVYIIDKTEKGLLCMDVETPGFPVQEVRIPAALDKRYSSPPGINLHPKSLIVKYIKEVVANHG